jgi:uncharacterized protein involved in exopolysaccharide biosynthesis
MHEHRSMPYTAPPPLEIRSGEPPEPSEVSLLGAVNVILRHRWLVVGIAVALATLVVLVGLIGPRTYSSVATFMPQSRRVSSALSGLASQFGVTLPTQDATESPQFYVDLLQSRDILRSVVGAEYEFTTDTGRVKATLVELYRPSEETPALRIDAAVRHLQKNIDAKISPRTSVITLEVTSPYPAVSQQIAARVIDLINVFNLERRQSQAAEERRFAEQRLEDVRRELRATEDRLQYFLQSNREYDRSPALRFQYERLSSEVALQRQLFSTLAQAREQAKIDEVRDTPVITVISSPEVPVRPDSRGLALRGIVGLLLGAALGCVIAFARAIFGNPGTRQSTEFEEFVALRRETIGDLTRPWRPLARLLGRRAAAG